MVTMVSRLAMLIILAVAFEPLLPLAADNVQRIKHLAAKYNVTSILVFGDSTVDPGNNNRLVTVMKSNFPPYGKDFFDGHPTGRFSNGRLPTDFLAEALGYTKAIPAFLDPNLKPTDVLHGVSFASGGSGYDDLTANFSNVLPLSKQIDYLKHYKLHLSGMVGENKAQDIIHNAIFLLSMGTNDFLQNYYLEPIRPKQYTLEEYQDFLASRMFDHIKEMHGHGGRRFVVVGMPPLGCLPLVKTITNSNTCVKSYNEASLTFNSKIKEKLVILRTTLGAKIAFVDCYGIIQNVVNNPKAYGLLEASKGCCGSGAVEYAISCRGLNTCADASKYVFWDAVHPTEKMYQVIANAAIKSLNAAFLR